MKLCVYQGTFNPVHNAHIEVAKYVHSNLGCGKILFIPAFKPPHKESSDYDEKSAFHRLNMVKLAVKGYDFMEVSDIEYKRNQPSYTYYTLEELIKTYNLSAKINFIIGTDAFKDIESWHRADELKNLADFILFQRGEDFDESVFENLKNKGYNYKLENKPFVDISSSDIRQRVMQNREIYDIVPQEVADYIEKNGLYKL